MAQEDSLVAFSSEHQHDASPRAEGRDYEPASALLERVRAERDATPTAEGVSVLTRPSA